MLCFDLHGYRAEWLATHRVALASARAIGDRAGEAWVLNNMGMVLSQQRYRRRPLLRAGPGDPPGARRPARPGPDHATTWPSATSSRACTRRRCSPARGAGAAARGRPPVRRGHGAVQPGRGLPGARPLRRGDLLRAGCPGHRARDRLHRLEGWVLQHLGRAHRDSGRLEEGAALLEQALASHRAEGNKLGEAQDLEHLGRAMAQSGRPAEARSLLARAAELFEEIGENTRRPGSVPS